MERFFASLKKELVHQNRFKTQADAKAAFACSLGRIAFTGSLECIEVFYNGQRRHSAIGYITTAQVFENMTWKIAA